MSPVSRRTFLALVAGGAAAAAGAWVYRETVGIGATPAGLAADPTAGGSYVDHEGWVMTTADKEKIGVAPVPEPGAPDR